MKGKRPISERKLRANRANAKRSTGPRTGAGKGVSRRNALKHGILSRAIDLPALRTGGDQPLFEPGGVFASGILAGDSARADVAHILEKMMRVLALEKECMRQPSGLEQNARLLNRYERTLTNQLHARIRELGSIAVQSRSNSGRNS